MDRLENLKNIIMYLMADEHVSHRIPSSLEERQRMMRALMNVWSSESIQACLEGRVATNEDEVNVWEPRPISEDFLKMQDAELQMQCEDKGAVEISDITPQASDILLWQGDITRLKLDAIVNAANAQALGCWAPLHNCIDNCIHSAAGIQLRKECADKMQGRLLATGDAFITKGYNLPAKHVIHTVGPIIPDGIPTKEQEEQLAQCYRSCLDLAEQNGLESIAFCCISTGVFHFPNELAARIAIETVKSYPRHALKTIVFNVFLDKDRDIYQQLLGA
ncbi:MAG: protein-ADP-ribose hydrolase [Prevotella sp.]|nr:protein-ADP-ribose hydrolase [Prevotella sp.]